MALQVKYQREKLDISECNILMIDAHIKNLLRKEIADLPVLQSQLAVLVKQESCANQGAFEKITLSNKIFHMRHYINDIETTSRLGYYLLLTAEIITEYRKIQNQVRINAFVNTSSAADREKRQELVDAFLIVAREYIDINGIEQSTQKVNCTCGSKDIENIESTLVCNSCGNEVCKLDYTATFKDVNRINMTERYKYTKEDHFLNAVKDFECRQNRTIPESVYEKFQLYLDQHNITNVEKHHLYLYLTEHKLSDYYNDTNLIYHEYTHTPPPDLSGIKDKIMIDFRKVEKAIEDFITETGRANSITVKYKLYKIIQRNGFKVKKGDFYMLRTDGKLEEHDEMWAKICEKYKWTVLPSD
jgi:hypothetical protein